MAQSTDRHARETNAKIAKTAGTSAEQIRRAAIVRNTFTDGKSLMMAGAHSVNRLYKAAKGDNRAGLHILIPPELRDAIKAHAKANGQTTNELLTDILTQIFWEDK